VQRAPRIVRAWSETLAVASFPARWSALRSANRRFFFANAMLAEPARRLHL
jgi:hypothetical protein